MDVPTSETNSKTDMEGVYRYVFCLVFYSFLLDLGDSKDIDLHVPI